MQDFVTGPIQGNRLGPVRSAQTWRFAHGDAQLVSGSDYKLCTLPATVAQPIAMRIRAVDEVASDAATTDTLKLGSAANGTQYLNAVDLKSTAGTNFTTANDTVILTASTDIYLRMTTTGAKTVGTFSIILDAIQLNVSPLNTLEA